MITKEQIRAMVRKQKELNDDTNTNSWIFGINNKGNLINWCRCIHMEGSELIDSYPWKHWKDLSGEANVDNAKVELIDIWHFLLSYGIHSVFLSELSLLRNELKIQSTTKIPDDLYPRKEFNKDVFGNLIKENKYSELLLTLEKLPLLKVNKNILSLDKNIVDQFFESILDKIVDKIYSMSVSYRKNNLSLLEKQETLNLEALKGSLIETEDLILEQLHFLFSKKVMTFEKLLSDFFNIAKNELYFDYFVGLYFGKNALNKFRQDNGYKENTYIKHWFDGNEDNVHMMDVIKRINTFEEIYSELDAIYKKNK